MDLKVEGTQLESIIQAALLQALGSAGQEALVKEVVRHLTARPPNTGGYGRDNPSPLMSALHGASSTAAHQFFQEKLKSDPAFIASLDGLYAEALARFNHADTREKIVARMAERLSTAFDKDY